MCRKDCLTGLQKLCPSAQGAASQGTPKRDHMLSFPLTCHCHTLHPSPPPTMSERHWKPEVWRTVRYSTRCRLRSSLMGSGGHRLGRDGAGCVPRLLLWPQLQALSPLSP